MLGQKADTTRRDVQNANILVYAAEAKTYDKLHTEVWNWYEQRRYRRVVNESMKRLNRRSPAVPPHIVDVGAGTGNLTLKYLAAGCRVTSIDISEKMLDMLSTKLSAGQRSQCTMICADAETALQDIGTFDGICFSSVLHHLYDFKGIVKYSASRLLPGGFILNIHDPLGTPPKSRIVYRLHRILGWTDEKLYRMRARWLGCRITDFPDDTLAEYHQHTGLMNQLEYKAMLIDLGLQITLFETYTSRRFGLNAWMATELIGSENSFACVAFRETDKR